MSSQRTLILSILAILAIGSSGCSTIAQPGRLGIARHHTDATLDSYNEVWTSPSKNSAESMPIGNGDIGLNVWVETDGDLRFTIAKTDAYDQNEVLMKLGGLRVALSPNPFVADAPFTQELRLADGMIVITAGEGKRAVTLKLWVDANNPVIALSVDAAEAIEVKARLDTWRTETVPVEQQGGFRSWALYCFSEKRPELPEGKVTTPDVIVNDPADRLLWYHRNEVSCWAVLMKQQGFADYLDRFEDPLLHRTFGATVVGEGLVKQNDKTLVSARPQKHHRLSIHALTAQTETPQAWMDQLDAQVARVEAVEREAALAAHRNWWRAFWCRSYVYVSGDTKAEAVTRAYVLQRFVSACSARGAYPIKFNGSLFTYDPELVDPKYTASDPDHRDWGGSFWWQNTRLMYWPMLASGDTDMMEPLFDLYMNHMELAKLRNKLWFGCEGLVFPETTTIWGCFGGWDYGWDFKRENLADCYNDYVEDYFHAALELVFLMQDYYDHTGDEVFLRERLLPMAKEVLAFYDTRFEKDAQGVLVIYPSQSLETWQDARNPTPEVSALRTIVPRLLALPPDAYDATLRSRWEALLAAAPTMPIHNDDQTSYIKPAEWWVDDIKNCENPALYAVFPYRLYGVGRPDLDIAKSTWDRRRFKEPFGWQQNPIQAATLGLTGHARAMLVANAREQDDTARFPVFWKKHYDWTPDQCHGGNLLNTLQLMLLQHAGDTIYLTPAWPKEWDVRFKLHAPGRTTVRGHHRAGKIRSLTVTPSSRTKDVVVLGE